MKNSCQGKYLLIGGIGILFGLCLVLNYRQRFFNKISKPISSSNQIDFNFSKYQVSLYFQDKIKSCRNSYPSEEEMKKNWSTSGCWDYISSSDIYYKTSPSEQFEAKILAGSDLQDLEREKISTENEAKITNICVKKNRTINGIDKFIALICEGTYEYKNLDNNETVKGVAHSYTQCLYPLGDGNYFFYGTKFASIGSVIDNCQSLETSKLTGITIKPL